MKRSGKDPLRFDKRPLSIIMNDEIPYQLWEEEFELIKKQGYGSWIEYLKVTR